MTREDRIDAAVREVLSWSVYTPKQMEAEFKRLFSTVRADFRGAVSDTFNRRQTLEHSNT